MTLKKLGRYEVLRVLGKGAMGVVYEGRDPNLDRRVAIKTVKVENLSEEAAAEYEHRFRTEARSAARLQHPNIVSVYDSDRDGDVAFLVMEFIQGDDLKHHLDRGTRYTLEQSLKIIRDLLSALDYAHKQGIVHRDIKPANLLIEPGGRVKLTDFGVARIQDSGEATRTQGSMVGTLKYMAPEQVQGQKIDSRADLFSVGVVLYQLLTDKRPFDGDNDFSIIHQIIGQHPPPPSSANPRLPGALDAVVARALAKTREERFATARDFAVALQAAIRRAEDQTVVPPPNPNKRVEPSGSRPLTAPGSVPGHGTMPSAGSVSSVTQELELVYWKDVKDTQDAEDLQGFLEKFPAGIYADLARRRLRKLAGGDQTVVGTGTGTHAGPASVFATSQFPASEQPEDDVTRVGDDASRGGAQDASQLHPSKWIDEEYTRTLVQPHGFGTQPGGTMPMAPPLAAAPEPAPAPAPAMAAPVAAAMPPAPAPVVPPVSAPTATPPTASAPRAARKPEAREANAPAAAAKKKGLPVAAIAGVAVLAIAGVVAALTMGGGKDTAAEAAAVEAAAATTPAVQSAAAGTPAAQADPAAQPPAPADAPAATPVSATASVQPASPPAAAAVPQPVPAADGKLSQRREARASQRNGTTPPLAVPQPAPVPAAPPTARVEPEPPPRAPAANAQAAGGNYQAVDQCRERVFLARELCVAEACEKAGTRNHPLCIKHREDARLREESKQLGTPR